jgi:asparagine synthase (glutamine-hydrolysing)
MCGIVSVIDPAGVEAASLRRAVAALRHRGPDGQGTWLARDRLGGLAHARLAVIDPRTGAQPILSEDGQVAVVVNGEFYGFEEIRRDLEARGHRFATGSDSEIALHLWEDQGVSCLDHLRGEFALVLWDGRSHTLFAARDRFGAKPLCYAPLGGGLALASEAKALFALGVKPAWDAEAFFQAASTQYLPPDRTLFAGVRQLRPGHYLLARPPRSGRARLRVEIHPYWDLDHPLDGPAPAEADGIATSLLPALDEAVRLRLRADVPVCFHLSGGLDSTAVVALAARHLGRPPVCFSVAFEATGYDEREHARAAAAQLGAELEVIPVTQDDLANHLADAVWFSEGLAINGHLTAKYLLARTIRLLGFKVVLSGEGADEVFGGYAHFRHDLGEARPQADGMMAGIHLPEGDGLPTGAIERALGWVPTFLRAKATLGARLRTVLAEDFVGAFHDRDPFEVFLGAFDVPGQLLGRHRLDQASYLWSRSALANYILRTLGDGTEMAHGIEGRLPFLDHHLFALARHIHPTFKIRGGMEKWVLRRALRDLLPDGVSARPKQPFTAPPLGRFGAPMFQRLMHDVFGSSRNASLPFFDRARVLELLERFPRLPEAEQVASDPVLMLALSAGLAHERFGL